MGTEVRAERAFPGRLQPQSTGRAWMAEAQRCLAATLSFFYPDTCQICGLEPAGPAEGYVCPSCRTRAGGVRFIERPYCERCGLPYAGEITGTFECANCQSLDLRFAWARAAVVASELILDVIHRYKYRGAVWFEPFLAGLLVDRAANSLRDGAWDAIVPVPLHPVRRREREFNQAENLGRYLSAASGVPLNTRLLRRVESTPTQTQLSRRARVANVRSAFAVRPGVILRGQRVVVVDDVLTTGATTNGCARALLAAGAAEIGVWTVARGM